jgi:hypothetical protein
MSRINWYAALPGAAPGLEGIVVRLDLPRRD